MNKCSTYFRGYDSAPAMGDPYPSCEDIEADIKSLDDFCSEQSGKRKRG